LKIPSIVFAYDLARTIHPPGGLIIFRKGVFVPAQQRPERIVILGGGFGGAYCARALERQTSNADTEIILINRENFFLMTPLLFEAGSGVLDPRHAVSPIRRMLGRTLFILGAAESIDLEKKAVAVRSPQGMRTVEFDQLVIAVGGVTNTSLIPGSDKVMQFKTLRDAIILRNNCIQMLEEADIDTDEARRKKLLTFVIIGGGLVGIELQGELTEFIDNIRPTYPRIKKQDIHFELIEGGKRLVPELDEDMGDYAARTLARRGVNVRVNSRVSRIEDGSVYLPSGEAIAAKTIVLAAGVATNPLLAGLRVEKDKHGRIVVEPTMRSKSRPDVWALGDCASIPDPTGKPYPQLAQHALREAKVLAYNLVAARKGQSLKPFVYQSKGTLAALGRYRGVGKVNQFKVYGFAAWWVWRTYYLLQMPGFQRKLRVVIDWTVALFFKNDVTELNVMRN
jgi:NADH dehydrogenase